MIVLIFALAIAVRSVACTVAASVAKEAVGGGFTPVRARPSHFPAGSLLDPQQGKYLPCQPDRRMRRKALIL
jgi:hypothetical protein